MMTLKMKLLLSAASVAAAVALGATTASAQCNDRFAAATQQNSQLAQAGPLGDADRRDPHSDQFADKDSNFWVAERDPANARFAQANPDARDPHASRFAQANPDTRDPHASHFAQANPDARDPHDSRFADKDSNFWVAERDPANARFAQANPDARDPHAAHFAQANPDARDPHDARFAQANPDARDPHDSRFAAGCGSPFSGPFQNGGGG
jgi:hypothetical protein